MNATSTSTRSFKNASLVVLESRKADILAEHIQRLQGKVIQAPSLKEVPLSPNPAIEKFAKRLQNQEIQMMIFLTGVGTRYLFEALAHYLSHKQLATFFKQITTVVRGPKPLQALKDLGIQINLTVPEPNTWKEILETLDHDENGIELQDAVVAVQEYGDENPALIQGLQNRGAKVTSVPVYRWALPDDLSPLKNAIQKMIQGDVSGIFVTSAQQVRHLVQVADQMKCKKDLISAMKKLVIASIGPTSSEALGEFGFSSDFEPSHPKMGHLVAELAENWDRISHEKSLSISAVKSSATKTKAQANPHKIEDSIFMRACRGETVETTPIWLMRQAGRYMKEYNDIRRKVSFLGLCKNPELACEVTVYARNRIQADAAIIFSDILLILEPLGLKLSYPENEGPEIKGEFTETLQMSSLRAIDADALDFVYRAIQLTRAELPLDIPLIGFSGAPFTLSSYILEGGSSRHFVRTKKFMRENPQVWHQLMQVLTDGIIQYLQKQIHAGANALQLFDSWVGCLSPEDFRTYVYPYLQKIVQSIPKQIPLIYFGTQTGGLLSDIAKLNYPVVGVDHRIELNEAWNILGNKTAIQGNMDPIILQTTPHEIEKAAKSILDQIGQKKGFIFNLGHGILPQTPVDHVCRLIDFVHQYSHR